MWSGRLWTGGVGDLVGPAHEVEEPGDDAGREAPQDEVLVGADQVARADPARGVAHGDPVVGTDQLADRHPVDLVDLVGRGRPDRALTLPPREQRRDGEVARRQPQLGQLGEDVDARRVEPGLLLGLAQRGLARASRPGRCRRRGRRPDPGWLRMWWARSVSSRSGPWSPSPNSISTAPRRGSESSGGRKRVRSPTAIDRAPSSTGRSHSGSPAGPHSVDPEVLVDQVARARSTDSTCPATHRRPGRRRRRRRTSAAPSGPGTARRPGAAACGSASSG